MPTPSLLPQLNGLRVLVLNWRDVRHPQAGGAEQYIHQIARRWVAAGAAVTWFTARAAGQAPSDVIDGIRVRRSGGELSLYLHAAARMARNRSEVDVVVDCQNGIPFFSPLFAGTEVPVVQVVHHVHQDQFDTRFSRPVAAFGRFLEGPATRRVYGRRAVAAVSPSTRRELRQRLRFRGPIFVVPNGSVAVPELTGPRDPDPTVTVVSRLVPHKRIDLLLHHLRTALRHVPDLRVNVVGDGPERARLQALVTDLGLGRAVTFHGYQPDEVRDALLHRDPVVAGHRREPEVLDAGVDQHHRQPPLGQPPVVVVRRVGHRVEPAGEDDAGHPVLQEQVDVLRLGHPAGRPGAQQRGQPVLGQRVTDDVGQRGEDGVLQLGQHQADQPGPLPPQLGRALVAEHVQRGQHGGPGGVGDARPVVEHPAHRRLADAHFLRYFRKPSSHAGNRTLIPARICVNWPG